MTEDLGNKILEAGLKKLEELKAEQHRIEVEICLLQHQTQEVCPHPIEQVIQGRYAPETYFSYYKSPFRVCKKCGYAEDGGGFYYRLPQDRVVEIEEAMSFVRGRVLSREALDKIQRDDEAARVAKAKDYAETRSMPVPPVGAKEVEFSESTKRLIAELAAIEREASAKVALEGKCA